MITNIRFTNFKALSEFSISLNDFNILTGPNNNGKSTIIDGLRLLHRGYRFASRQTPKFLVNPFGKNAWGFIIPANSFDLNLGILQTDLDNASPSIIKFGFGNRKSLTLMFHPDHPAYLFFDTQNKIPRKATEFREEFPLSISIIPTLGPLEIDEELVGADYLKSVYGGRRSPRMFRSYWMYNLDKFDEFKQLVESTWPGMSVSYPEQLDRFDKKLTMFCEEERLPREVCWAGFGFQIWLQLLTHIINSKGADLIVVDEPEIYLHPDLQHKILDILRLYGANILIATHSVEIINSVDPSDVVLIDKKNKSAKRITDLSGLQSVSNILGSGQNIELTRLARGKKILFVEGKDMKLLSKLAKICKHEKLFLDSQITVIPIEGFSQHDKIIHTNWAFTQILGEELKIAVLLDRDYRADEDIEIVLNKLQKEVNYAHILKKKELENYFLIPTAISKAIDSRFEERIKSGSLAEKPEIDIVKILLELTDGLRSDILGQIIAHKYKMLQSQGKDVSTIFSRLSDEFEASWKDLDYRLNKASGKYLFTVLNEYLQKNYKISITYSLVSNHISHKDVDEDMISFFNGLEGFKNQL